jgi:hypothetical protein
MDAVTVTGSPAGVADGWDRERAIDGLQERLAEVCGFRNSFDAELVALAAEALEHRWWAQPGIVSPSHWLVWQAGLSPSRARQVIAVAGRRHELPVTFAAFEAGELSFDQVMPICAHAPAWADTQVCEHAKVMTVTQLRRVLRSYRFHPDPVDGEDHTADTADPRSEQVSLVQGDDGMWRLTGRLDADHGAIVETALREALDALYRSGSTVTPAMVDALVELAHRSLDTVTDPARRDRYRVHLHIRGDHPTTTGDDTTGDDTTGGDEPHDTTADDVAGDVAAGPAGGPDGLGATVDRLGYAVPEWLRDLVCCDTSVAPTIEHDGIPVSVGRSQYTVPERTRRLVILRDRGCRIPGCAHDRWLHIHHLDHYPDGGTDTWNLIAICPAHHRIHHRGQLGISGNADRPNGLTFTDRHGRPLRPNPLPRPPSGPAPPPTGHYQHPLGERLTTRWITFNPPRPRPTDTT